MANLLWLQGGACSGNTMSFLNAEQPSACDLITDFGIKLLWHPSLGMELGENLRSLLHALTREELPLDVFVFEGTVVQAPDGTGQWNRFAGRPMKDWVSELTRVARYVVAIGDCATWGGIPATAPNPSQSTGLQFLKRNHGGFLGAGYRSRAGLPVINVPGCPAHPDWITQILVAVATGRADDVTLDDLQRPSGPMTHSPCNRILWNRQSSKTRAGMPCLGCTEPEFPFYDLEPGTVFKTQTIMGVPRDMPAGIDKPAYIRLTAAAKTASPQWAEDDIFVV